MSVAKVLYRADASATGGRDGRAITTDGHLDVALSTPVELGGAGGTGTNPEQLFAAGYSACFLSAMKFVAMQAKLPLHADTKVQAEVGIGATETGFGLEVALNVTIPEMDRDQAQQLVDRAHQVCPYSNATRNNIAVQVALV